MPLSKRNILLLINPKAGTDRKKNIYAAIDRILDASHFDIVVKTLSDVGDGRKFARKAVEDRLDTVVAIGGDGTINEIAQELVNTPTALGIIPLGSGNGLARALKIPRNISDALRIIATGRCARMDVGYANEHLFLSNAGVGFDALIAERFKHSKRRGLANYARLVLSSFAKYRPLQYRVEMGDMVLEQEAFLLTIANGNQFGYDFKLTPKANVFDGWLDLCIVPPIHFYDLLPLGFESRVGWMDHSKYLVHQTAKELTITSEDFFSLQLDGDAVTSKNVQKVQVRIAPKALRIVIPESLKLESNE
jgi:diacylglycerol kinase (ATP)